MLCYETEFHSPGLRQSWSVDGLIELTQICSTSQVLALKECGATPGLTTPVYFLGRVWGFVFYFCFVLFWFGSCS